MHEGHIAIKKQKIARRFAIDTDVCDISRIKANLSNGVLVIVAPKKSKPKVIKIPVTEHAEIESLVDFQANSKNDSVTKDNNYVNLINES